MQVSEDFLKAKKDKNLSAFLFVDRFEGGERQTVIRLVINVSSKYGTNLDEKEFVSTPASVSYADYSREHLIHNNPNYKVVFHESVYEMSHIKTFLKAIKKNSEVRFRVVAYNGNEAWDKIGYVHHTLYGLIDGNPHLLSYYVGSNNTASPIQI